MYPRERLWADCEAEVAQLREALRPFAALPVMDLGQCQRHPDEPVFAINGVAFTAADVLRAKELLTQEEANHGHN